MNADVLVRDIVAGFAVVGEVVWLVLVGSVHDDRVPLYPMHARTTVSGLNVLMPHGWLPVLLLFT